MQKNLRSLLVSTFAMTSLFSAFSPNARAESTELPRMLSYNELLALSPAKREAYVEGIRQIQIELSHLDDPALKGLFADVEAPSAYDRYTAILEAAFGEKASAQIGTVTLEKLAEIQKKSAQADAELEMARTEYNSYGWITMSPTAKETARVRLETAKAESIKANQLWQRAREQAPKSVDAMSAKRGAFFENQEVKQQTAVVKTMSDSQKVLTTESIRNDREVSRLRKEVAAQPDAAKSARIDELDNRRTEINASIKDAASQKAEAEERVRTATVAKADANQKAAATASEAAAAQKSETKNLNKTLSEDTKKAEADKKAAADVEAKKLTDQAAIDAAMTGQVDPSSMKNALLTGKEIPKDAKSSLACKSLSSLSKDEQLALKKRLYTNKKAAAAVKTCNVGGFFSSYKGARGKLGTCQEQYQMCIGKSTCAVNGKPLACREKGLALCDPMSYGVKRDGSPFCTRPTVEMSAQCDTISTDQTRMPDFLNQKIPGLKEEWKKRTDGYRSVCGADAKGQDKQDILTVNCTACQHMAKRILDVNKQITGKADLGEEPDTSASPATGKSSTAPARQ